MAWPMNDNQDGPVPPRGRAIVFRQHAVHDVLVDVDAKRPRHDARNPRTAESRIARLEFDDRPNERVVGTFRAGFLRTRLG